MESVAAECGEAALACFNAEPIDLVLSDLRMPDMDGIELLRRIRGFDAEVPVIILTAHGTVHTAVEAMKQGAFDFILKPFDVAVVEMTIRKALELGRYRVENRYLKEQVAGAPAFENLIGQSPAMQAIADMLRQVGPTRSTVLITGETGTGKELVARAIHNLSPRRDQLFVPLNCARFRPTCWKVSCSATRAAPSPARRPNRTGKFELANGGTLFLDEIGDMAYPCRRSYSGCCRKGSLIAWAATSGRRSMSACSPPPTVT